MLYKNSVAWLVTMVLAMLPLVVQAEQDVHFDLPAQPLATSLRAVANQSSTNVLFDQKLVDGLQAPALKAQLTPREAIARLLAGTGVVYEFVNEHTVVLASSSQALEVQKDQAQKTGGVVPPVRSGGNGAALQLARAEEKNETATTRQSVETDEMNTGEKGIPEMLIRGRRTSNTDIQRTEDDIQPYVVFKSEDIERSGASNLGDFFKTRLPMNTVQATNAQQPGSSFGNQSQVNLRGLGTSQTLILVNGRRMPNISATSITTTGFVQPDINGIPIATVERIEVLPSTASGIYGGGATGGVINIILKRDYSGVELLGTYDNTFQSDYAQRRLDGSAGFSLEGGKTSIQLSASYSDSNRLLGGERDFTGRALALQLGNNPDVLNSLFFPPRGRTSNILSAFGEDLVFAGSGVSLGSPITHVPEGYAGVDTDGGAALALNAGSYNFDQAEDVQGTRSSRMADPMIESFAVSLRRELGSRVEAFVDLAAFNNKSTALIAGLPVVAVIEPGSPNNPFTDPIVVNFPSPGFERDAVSDSLTRQAAGGLIFRLPHRWTAHTEYSWSRSRFKSASYNPAISTAGLDALDSGMLDVVRDLNLYPLDYSPYAFNSPTQFFGPADTVLQDATVRVAGPTVELPGGPLNLSALVEYREEEARDFVRETNFSGGPASAFTYQPSRVQKVRSAYVEATAPFISARNALPMAQSLEVQLSVRRDEYETVVPATSGIPIPSRDAQPAQVGLITNDVASTDFTVGLRFSPVESLALRASFGTGFLPPSIAQLFPSVAPATSIFVADPKREKVRRGYFPVHVTRGGNPDLTPEESESWSAGAVFTPATLPALRVSLDYTRIEKTDEIGSFLFQEILDNEDFLPGRVTRAELTQEDIDAGFEAGAILAVNSTSANIASTELEAFDLQTDYNWTTRAGIFSLYALATYQPHLKRRILSTSDLIDRAGFIDGLVKWRGNAGLTLERQAWTFGWSAQYYDSYKVYESNAPDSAISDLVLSQGAPNIPGQTYHDLFVRYRIGAASFARGLFSDTEIMFNIQNVFDKVPPIIATDVADSGYSLYGDPRLRRYSLSLTRRF